MKGKKVLITGATDGIGKRTAIELAKMGFEVIIHGRNGFRGKQVLEEVRAASENENISYEHADLSSLREVKKLDKGFPYFVKNITNFQLLILSRYDLSYEEKERTRQLLPNCDIDFVIR